MTPLTTALFALVATAIADPGYSPSHPHGPWGWQPHQPPSGSGWDLKKFSNLIAFGDSYTDDSRLTYIFANNGSYPPVGYENPVNYASSTGGRTWAEYVKQYAGISLHNYAVGGAVCSNDITPRTISGLGGVLFPSVKEYEIPTFIAETKYVEPNGAKFIPDLSPDETVYSIWIGTNDLGVDCLLTDSQVQGTNIVTYTSCVYDQLQRLYDQGGRYFVIMDAAPLNLAPLYGLPGKGGVASDNYWPDKPSNITEISYRMMEQVVTVNAIYQYQTPFVAEVAKTFTGAKFAVMDVHGLFTDIYNNPSAYLNGTAPLNVTGAAHECNVDQTVCTTSPSPDSFLWYDDLHLSEQTSRVVAREFVNVVKGASKWAMYWGQ